ncbi:MAG TPA: DUF2341 domain-containing protein, partial [Bacteroidales bacterium]|nr:DUF2341 domain-containing protein [Bacteroidales bacterium]
MKNDPKIHNINKLTYLITVSSRILLIHRRLVLVGLVFLLSFISTYSQWLTGYQYRKTVTIPAAQISGGPHTDFPVLVTITDADLRTMGNLGLVQNANGWDIVFSIDHSTVLNQQVESYNPVTGQITAWVRIPTLSGGANFVFYLYFGNASVVTDPSTTATWSSAYKGVWHLSGLQDATINGNTATNSGTSNTTGIIDYARDVPGTGQYFQITQITIPNANFSISVWFRPDVVTDGTLFDLSNSGTLKYFFSAFNSTSLWWYFESANENDVQITYNTNLNTSTWYYLTVIGRYNNNYHEIYLNGNFVGSSNTILDNKPVLNDIRVGADYGYYPIFAHGDFNGRIDEFRISNLA